MRDLVLLADEPAESAAGFGALGLAVACVRHRVGGAPAAEFVLDDPSGTLEPLAALRALCRERGLRPVYAAGTTDAGVVYAALWAEALGVRCACPPESVDFFYDRAVQRRELGDHPWNLPAVTGDELAALPGAGPWAVKARGGPGRAVRCSTVEEVAEAVGDEGADRVVEPWLPGADVVVDAFYIHGAIRLTALAESTVDDGFRVHLAGPVIPQEIAADLLADLAELLTEHGFEEGPVHARFRLRDNGRTTLLTLRPRPGNSGLSRLGARTGAADLMDCYRRMLHGQDLPAYAFPTTWAYQLHAPAHAEPARMRAVLPEAEFVDRGPQGWSLLQCARDERTARALRDTAREALSGG